METKQLADYPPVGRRGKENIQNRGTLGEIAKMAGVGHTTAEQYDAFSRRHLPTETKLALAYKFKEFEAEKARDKQGN